MSEISPILVLPTKKTNKISDMTKVAIKNENITSFGGIYHIMDVFSKLGFEKLTESVLGKRGSSGKAFCYGSIFGSLFFSYLCGGECLEDINALIGSSSRDLITQNATRLISRKTPGRRQSYSSPKSTPFSLLLPQCTERAQRAHVARASAVFDFLPSPLHLLGIKSCGTTG